MKLWKLYLIVAIAITAILGVPALTYILLKEPPGVLTKIDVFECDLANVSGTLTLKGPCVGKYINVSVFLVNKTYLKYDVAGRLKLEITAEDMWAGMTTVGDIIENRTRSFRIQNNTYFMPPENLVPPSFRAALAKLARRYPWLRESYLVNGGIFRGLVKDPIANQTAIGIKFSSLTPLCSLSTTQGLGGGVVNRYDACSFTALLLVNKTRLVVFDVEVTYVNIEGGLEVVEGRNEVRIGGGVMKRLFAEINNATRLLEEVVKGSSKQ
ncbi:MAG: hypothetical protein QW086_03380 [Pyrobaculum sp.]